MVRRKLSASATVAMALALTATLAACGSTKSSASSSSKSSGPTSGAVAAAKAEIAKYSNMPQATPPGPKFDASKARGKVVWTIPTASSVPVIQLENAALGKAFATVGVKLVNYTTDGSPSSWVNAMNQAIGHNANLIILEGVNPQLISAQVQQAKAARIPVIWDWAVQGPVSQVAPDVTATNPLDFTLGSKLLADLATVYSKGKADVQLFGLTTQRQDPVYTSGIKSNLASLCPACKVAGYTNVPIPDWSQHLTQETQNLLQSHPNINVLIPYYDGMVEFLAPGVSEAGAAGKVQVITHDGTPAVLQDIKNGNVVVADVGESRSWQAWACADQALRVLTNTAPLAAENVPVRIWTKQNISQATGPNDENGYGNSYVAMYESLWGVKG